MRTLILSFVLVLPACEAHVGTASSLVTVPKDSAATCGHFCSDLGMTLSSVVVMASNVGCVCNPAKAAGADDHGGGAAAGAGMATIFLQEQQQRQQQAASAHP